MFSISSNSLSPYVPYAAFFSSARRIALTLYLDASSRVSAYVAIALLAVYQALDAIDGKHAKNALQVSPLGEVRIVSRSSNCLRHPFLYCALALLPRLIVTPP